MIRNQQKQNKRRAKAVDLSSRIPLLALLVTASLTTVSAQPSVPELQKLGGKIREEKGLVVELTVETDTFTEADYRLIGQCTGLKKLTLNGKTLTDITLPLLAGLTNLEELSTNQSTLTDEGYRHFAALQNLKVLHLWHPSWGLETFTGSGIAHLKALPKLERLTFAGSTAGDEALSAVGQLTQLKSFQTWHSAQTQAGNLALTKLPNLTSLKIGQRLPKGGATSPPSFDGSTIPTLAKISSLETLELFEARLTFDDLVPLKDLPKLKKLSIHTTDIPETDVEKLRGVLPGVEIVFKPLTAEEAAATLVKKLKL